LTVNGERRTANGERRTANGERIFFPQISIFFPKFPQGTAEIFRRTKKFFRSSASQKKILSSPLAFREMRPYIDTTSRRMLHGRC